MSLTLTRQGVVTPTLENQHAWILKVTAVSTTAGLPSEIFVYRSAGAADPYNEASFECVASLSQIEELGLTPITLVDSQIPFYRSAVLELVFRSAEELEYYWGEIKSDALDLLENLTAATTLTTQESYVIG
jgi:hypothetical protein